MAKIKELTTVGTSLLVCVGQEYVPCESFKEASEIVLKFIENNNLGSNCFYTCKHAGNILHHTKGIIACVSYNGRVWISDGTFSLKRTEITNLTLKDIPDDAN